ncbi:VirB4 family type IV secretion system protein [Thermovirga lienii]|uniref:VirB4 family type IV secretion system protein n=1 Tax=Thermovirga lienii TaxID=336261 RepID=UPI002FDF91F4
MRTPTKMAVEEAKKNVVKHSLSSELPYEEVVDGIVIYNDGSVGMCYKTTPAFIDCMSVGEKEMFFKNLFGAFSTLPPHIHVQVVWEKTSTTPILDRMISAYEKKDNRLPIVDMLIKDREAFWRYSAKKNNVFNITCEIWLRGYYPRLINGKFSTLLSKGYKDKIQQFLKEHVAITHKFKEETGRFFDFLQNVFPDVWQASNQEVFKAIWEHLLGSDKTPVYKNDCPLNEYFGGIDVVREWGYIGIGNREERYISILSADDLPEKSHISMVNHMLTLPFPFTIVMNASPVSLHTAKKALRKQLRRYESLLAVSSDPELINRRDEVFLLLQEMEESHNPLLDTELFCIVPAPSLADLTKRVDMLITTAQAKVNLFLQPEKAALLLAFKASLPGGRRTGDISREFRVKADNVADFAPIYGPMKSADRPTLLLSSPYRGMYGYDIFDPRLPAWNALVIGGTGAGKSFFTNLLLLSAQTLNPYVFIIDKGGSYKKVTHILDGSYIDVGSGEVSFNPFECVGKWTDNLGALSLILQEIVRKAPNEPVDKAQQIIIERLLDVMANVYGGDSKLPTLSDAFHTLNQYKLYDTEKSNSEVELLAKAQQEVALYLSRWTRTATKGTSFASKLLDNPTTNVTLQNRVVAFDLHGLEHYPQVMNVMFLVLNMMIKNTIKHDLSTPKIIVFDETWALLKTQEGAAFLEELYRTVRKYNCMVLSISQDLDDFAQSPSAGALIANTYQYFILRQASSTHVDKIQQLLRLSDEECVAIRSLDFKKGFFSEFFFKLIGVGSSKMAVVPSPIEYWLATTDAKDMHGFLTCLKNGMSVQEAVATLAKKYPHGITASVVGLK